MPARYAFGNGMTKTMFSSGKHQRRVTARILAAGGREIASSTLVHSLDCIERKFGAIFPKDEPAKDELLGPRGAPRLFEHVQSADGELHWLEPGESLELTPVQYDDAALCRLHGCTPDELAWKGCEPSLPSRRGNRPCRTFGHDRAVEKH